MQRPLPDLDCPVRPVAARVVLAYFATGFLLLFALQAIYAQRFGGDFSRLLHVEETSLLRPFIEKDLGHLDLGTRHDGQVNYAIARRPLGDPEIHPLIAPAGFRYRRWLYPLLAGGFGMFSPGATLWGLVLLASAGAGAATAALGLLAERYGLSPLVVLTVLCHPGVWIACQILTGDNVALAFALWGVVLWLESRTLLACVLLALAGLTKEVYLFVPFGLMLHDLSVRRFREAFAVALTPLPLLAWTTSFALRFPDPGGFTAWGDLALPFVGLWRAVQVWNQTSTEAIAYNLVAIAGVLLCLWTAIAGRPRVLRFLAWPWVVLAIVVSEWIWSRGSDSVRGLLPVWIIGGVHLAVRFRRP